MFSNRLTQLRLAIKRGLDLVVSSTLLVISLPVLVAVAILIKLTSPGPIFVLQARLGQGRRQFPLIKFRTMRVDVEEQLAIFESFNEVSGPVFKIKNDPRVTRFGHFLRRTDIDELPQLLNVVKGDMSLVGPRPALVSDNYRNDDVKYEERFRVRPGMTGLWQVSSRSSLSFDQMVRLDAQYVETWSLWKDAQILMKTVPALFLGRGAA
jgi:lipopolysaccharide/colanic/teichoic acid biosynthesis glycosyltransferase